MHPTYVVVVVLVAVLAFLLHVEISCGLSIAAFNIQTLGPKKSGNKEVLEILTKIIQRYDVILIQEIRDNTNKTISDLLSALNRYGSPTYYDVTSERLGSTASKEQYSFLLRSDSGITVLDKYQYPEELKTFERPPFSLKLRSEKSEIREFALSGIHVRPDSAVREIGNLSVVHDAISNLWHTDNILIMGDLNAACKYASRTALQRLDIRKNPPYRWLIPDDADTTTTTSNCSYDRFIMTGDQFYNSLTLNSTKVFRFDQEFGLNINQTLAVSDHYPIELKLSTSLRSSLKSWSSTLLPSVYVTLIRVIFVIVAQMKSD